MQTSMDIPRSRILVVEDDPGTRALMLRVLKENGYDAT